MKDTSQHSGEEKKSEKKQTSHQSSSSGSTSSVFSNKRMSKADIQELQECYSMFDKDGSGTISTAVCVLHEH